MEGGVKDLSKYRSENAGEDTEALSRSCNTSYAADDAINIIFTKLDEAIDDMENGRVLSEAKVWKELDAVF